MHVASGLDSCHFFLAAAGSQSITYKALTDTCKKTDSSKLGDRLIDDGSLVLNWLCAVSYNCI